MTITTRRPTPITVCTRQAAALAEEVAAHGDVLFLDTARGMNFAVELLSAMRMMSDCYTFDFFLRLDDE